MKTRTSSLIAVAALCIFLLPTAQAGTRFGLYIGDYHHSDRHHSSKKDYYRGKKDYHRSHRSRKDYHRGGDHKYHKRHHSARGSHVIIISPRSHYRSGYGHGYRDYRDHGGYRGYRKHYRY